MRVLNVLDLFSGIGGFSLGLERTGGFKTVAFCEIEAFPRKVLAKHWPTVPCYNDVRKLTAERLASDGISVDVITGGFPCQDISFAGLGAGLSGERSGLFFEIARLIGELGPRYVILENVSALLYRGLDEVLGTLASLGYDAEWHCIPASYIGAHHRRDRIWIVAHPNGRDDQPSAFDRPGIWSSLTCQGADAYACGTGDQPQTLADAMCIDEKGQQPSFSDTQEWQGPIVRSIGSCSHGGGWWSVEPAVGRVANGIPDRAHRLKGLGNAVVPQIPELIGRAIIEKEKTNG